jgi:hypothetical protein
MNANKGLLLESTDVLAAPSLFNDLFCDEVRSVLPSPPVGDERLFFWLTEGKCIRRSRSRAYRKICFIEKLLFFRVHSRLFAVVLS